MTLLCVKYEAVQERLGGTGIRSSGCDWAGLPREQLLNYSISILWRRDRVCFAKCLRSGDEDMGRL